MRKQATMILLGSSLMIGAAWADKPDHHPRDASWYDSHPSETAEEHRRDVARREAYWEAHSSPSASEYKEKKHKALPPGLAKKYQRTGELPPGWQKKIAQGQVLTPELYPYAREVPWSRYPNLPYDERSKIYEIEDKVFRVMNGTREILDVLR